jgi:hypothetical protein
MNCTTFVVAVNDKDILRENFLSSPCLRHDRSHQVLLQEGFASAAEAYNAAIEDSVNDLMVFVHQDVWLPESWSTNLESAIQELDATDPNWGVLGCIGTAADTSGRGFVYSLGRGAEGEPLHRPEIVQTLDELVLVIRKSSGLRFDMSLPNFHFYGTDICLRATVRGLNCYAIPAPCVHNTQQNLVLPKEFYESYAYIRRTWRNHLPIHTTCISVTKSNIQMYWRQARELYLRLIGRRVGAMRIRGPLRLSMGADGCSIQIDDRCSQTSVDSDESS